MSKKYKKSWKILYIEDGSVNVDEIQKWIEINNLNIKIIVYRQGSIKPELKEL